MLSSLGFQLPGLTPHNTHGVGPFRKLTREGRGSKMRRFLVSLKKHFFIYLLFMKNSTMGFLEYRANLFAALTMELVYLFSKILYVIVFYNSSVKIDGVSPDEIMLYIGTFILMTGLFVGFFMDNFYQIPEHIRTGTLDTYITKPVSLQFIATMREFNIVLLTPNLIAGTVLVSIAWKRLGIAANFHNIGGYVLIILSSLFISYAVFLFPQILSFWTIKSGAITEVADKCWDFNNMPMLIYNKWMQRVGVFLIPIFCITNFPAMFVLGNLSTVYFVWVFIAPVLFFTLITLFWRYAVRNYTSASS